MTAAAAGSRTAQDQDCIKLYIKVTFISPTELEKESAHNVLLAKSARVLEGLKKIYAHSRPLELLYHHFFVNL